MRSPRCAGMPKEGECQRGARRTGFSFAAEYVGSAKEKLRPNFGRNSARKEAQDKANALCFALATGLELPAPGPCRCSVAMRKVVLLIFITHIDLRLHRYIRLRSGVDLRCVLVGWQDKRPAQDTRLTAGRKSIGYARRGMQQPQDSLGSVASTQECTDGNSM